MYNHSESIVEITKALCKAQGEFKAAPMNKENPHFRSRYADLGSIISTATPVLAKNNLAFTQLTHGNGENIAVTTILMHTSGEFLQTQMDMPLRPESGRQLVQSMGAIISYLRRYTLASMLGIYADEDVDGEIPSGEQKQNGNGAVERPYPPEILLKGMTNKLDKYKNAKKPSESERGGLLHSLELCFIGQDDYDDKRHALLEFLTGDASTTKISGAWYKVLVNEWLKPRKAGDESGEFTIDAMACKEANLVVEFLAEKGGE